MDDHLAKSDEMNPGKVDSDFAQRLQFLWDQYNKIIQLTVIMSGATIGVLISVGLESDRSKELRALELLFLAVVLAGIAGVLALLWRFFAQVIMERQIYGPREAAIAYFRDTWVPLALRFPDLKFLGRVNEVTKVASGLMLLASWITAIALLFKNLNGNP